jgi:hypothetical protein
LRVSSFFSSLVALSFISANVQRIEKGVTRELSFGDCGKSESVEDARALGCVFDPLNWSWVRPACYHKDLVDEFMNRTTWSWHTDPKLTPESAVPMEEVLRGDHPILFTSKMFHTVHCAVSMSQTRTSRLFRLGFATTDADC